MKTDNTPENKARLFSIYYGQKVMQKNTFLETVITCTPYGAKYKDYRLYLRSISSLTDDEYKWFAHHSAYKLDNKNIVSVGKAMVKAMFEPNGWSGNTLQQMCDYLRSIGILIPWMDLSVEDIKAYGWAKEVVHA